MPFYQGENHGLPNSPVVEAPPCTAAGANSIPGQGVKIPHALWPKSQNMKEKQYCNKFNKDFFNGPNQKKKKEKNIGVNQELNPNFGRQAPALLWLRGQRKSSGSSGKHIGVSPLAASISAPLTGLITET